MRCHEIPSGRTTMDTASLDSWLQMRGSRDRSGPRALAIPTARSSVGGGSIPRQARLFMGSQWIYVTTVILPRDVDNINNGYVE